MIKVLHLVQTLCIGGLESRVLRLAGGLDKGRYAISVMTLREYAGRKLAVPAGVRETHFPIPSGLHPGRLLALARFLRREGFHIVHTHNWATHFYGVLAAFLAGTPVILHGEHGINFKDTLGIPWKRRLAQRLLTRLGHGVIAVTEAMEKNLPREFGTGPGKVSLIACGVDLVRFRPKAGRETEGPGPSRKPFTIGTLGRLDAVKNLPCLLKAFALFHQGFHRSPGQGLDRDAKAPETELLLVGGGPKREELEALARELGIADQVLFAGDTDRPEDFYSRMDLFVNCSFSEGLSIALQEAMATGLPLAVSDIEGNASWLAPERDAFFFPGGDEEALARIFARAYRDFSSDGEVIAAMGRRNRERVEREFDNRQFLAKYDRLYRDLLSQKGIGTPEPEPVETRRR